MDLYGNFLLSSVAVTTRLLACRQYPIFVLVSSWTHNFVPVKTLYRADLRPIRGGEISGRVAESWLRPGFRS
jgi:hypothetical protein